MKTQQERKQKLLLLLPLVMIPLLALAFYALGGGRGDEAAKERPAGLNTRLPGAQLKEQPVDKLALYDQVKRDSAHAASSVSDNAFAAVGWDTTANSPVKAAKTHEAEINRKLSEINRQISQPVTNSPPVGSASPGYHGNVPAGASSDMDRLEKLLQAKQRPDTPDPEMQQLNTMLDKIMQIQNPSLVKPPVAKTVETVKDSTFRTIPALIDGNQKVAPGGVVKLKLADSMHLGPYLFEKGQSLSGLCSVTNQRLLLEIRNIRIGTSIMPVSLTVFSLDGMAGINAPEAELGEAAGNGANSALSGMQFLSMDQSLGAQAASAGISAAKDLLDKKVKKIRVKLKGGQQVLLRINRN
jgi:hypothetical protein